MSFFVKSTRGKNDAANKIRESVLEMILKVPDDYLNDTQYGKYWTHVRKEWLKSLEKIGPSDYTSITCVKMAGRSNHHDYKVIFEGINPLTLPVEFKNGGTAITKLPQILSLPANFQLLKGSYEEFYYKQYLDLYLECDEELIEKPPLEEYLKEVKKATSKHPFFVQLKIRDSLFKDKKDKIVNNSIRDYLTTHIDSLDLQLFSEKLYSSQAGKHYLLWNNGQFYYDNLKDHEMKNMTFLCIKNGNVIQAKSGNTIYNLLLRWRNHKGVLNPAWQISMKRL